MGVCLTPIPLEWPPSQILASEYVLGYTWFPELGNQKNTLSV